jgi:hypothetical protein
MFIYWIFEKKSLHPVRPGRPLFPRGPVQKILIVLN